MFSLIFHRYKLVFSLNIFLILFWQCSKFSVSSLCHRHTKREVVSASSS
uniref:Uncharacterized protein n=1 Tax=Solanum lycopersicum TaxID=4081 RepID=A0A3Q7FZ20_SOLLC